MSKDSLRAAGRLYESSDTFCGKVTLYSERGFTGESRLITGDADLTGDGFDDKTGSGVVEAP